MSEPVSALSIIAAVAAAGLGAVCRLLLDGAVSLMLQRASAWGTVVVNLSGSLAIGVVAGLLTAGSSAGDGVLNHAALTAETLLFVAILGFISGYTTFSTASYQTVRLAQSGRWGAAIANGLGQLASAALAVALGWGGVLLITGLV